MKIIQITDNHLVTPGDLLDGLNPIDSLDACIEAVNSHQSDADFCVFSGDISNNGAADTYRAFRKSADKLNLKYYVMMGNHDDRNILCENLPEAQRDANGFIQQVIKTDLGHILLLDTIAVDQSWGEYCELRGQWLRQQLLDAGDQPVYIFMHHPPFVIGMAAIDRLKVLDIKHFEAAIEGFTNIRHIFLGHVHRTISGNWRNISYSVLPGTNHQIAFNLDVFSPVPHALDPPAYGMILIEKDQIIVHPHFYSLNKDLPIPDNAVWVEKPEHNEEKS